MKLTISNVLQSLIRIKYPVLILSCRDGSDLLIPVQSRLYLYFHGELFPRMLKDLLYIKLLLLVLNGLHIGNRF